MKRYGSLTTATRKYRKESGKGRYIKHMISGSRMLGSRNSKKRTCTFSSAGESKAFQSSKLLRKPLHNALARRTEDTWIIWWEESKLDWSLEELSPWHFFPRKVTHSHCMWFLHDCLSMVLETVPGESLYQPQPSPTHRAWSPDILALLLLLTPLHHSLPQCLPLPLVRKSSQLLLQRLVKEVAMNGSMASHLHERLLQAQKHQGRGRAGGQVRPCL